MANKVYVVGVIGWEYNDQNYYRGDYKTSTPKAVYRRLKNAQDFCDEQNIKFLRSISAREYSCEFSDLFSYGAEAQGRKLLELFDPNAEDYYNDDGNMFERLTDEQIKNLLPYLDIKMYEITEVEIED
jgi:hypothetical protein